MSAYIPTLAAAAVAVFVAVFTAIFGIVNYRRQKETDRKVELRNRRMKEYERYLTAFRAYTFLYDYDPPPAENDEDRIKAVNEYWLAYSNLFQLASDPVLLAVSEFHRFDWIGDHNLTGEDYTQEFKRLYAQMIIEMRKDAFEQTKLQRDLVEQRIPFKFSPAVKRAGADQEGGEA